MKIIYCGVKNENYDPKRGASFEYNNFYLTLKNMPEVEVVEFPFDQILNIGREQFNKNLLELITKEKPDLLFVFMYTDEIDINVFSKFKIKNSKLRTIAWFADDHWRLDNYSRFYAPYFDWVVTTYSRAPEIYASYGIKNVIRSQWACNTALWKPQSVISQDIDVSFVGQRTSARTKIINNLRAAGINVFVRGYGWPEGKVSQKELIEIIARSKINLNFNTPRKLLNLSRLARIFLKKSIVQLVFDWHFISNLKSWWNMSILQIKARPFEILGCRAFLISADADDMKNYYEDGREIAYYDHNDNNNLVQKIKYYLDHPIEREKIAEAGYMRTLRDHTYIKRFKDIFEQIGL